MKNLIRKRDILNYSKNLEQIHKIKKFPVFMGAVTHPEKEDILSDMIWEIGTDTGMIQLKKLVPLDVLYQSNHSSGLIGNLWNLHHEKFAKFISKFNPKKVFEIGGAHGILAKKYEAFNPNIDWTIIEPNPIPIEGSKAKFIKGFFNENSNFDLNDSTIIHSHTLEHIYDPNMFLKSISQKVEHNAYQIFSVPNINEMIKRKYTNGLNFEHTYFLTEEFIKIFLENSGFEIVEKEFFQKDHSIFICAKKNINLVKDPNLKKNYYEINKKTFMSYVKHYDDLISQLNIKISKLNSSVYLFGAHIFSQYLITNGLKVKKIKSILDNDPLKKKKRLYGTSLIVDDPLIIKNEDAPVVILKAGVYTEEIKTQIINDINKNCIFL